MSNLKPAPKPIKYNAFLASIPKPTIPSTPVRTPTPPPIPLIPVTPTVPATPTPVRTPTPPPVQTVLVNPTPVQTVLVNPTPTKTPTPVQTVLVNPTPTPVQTVMVNKTPTPVQTAEAPRIVTPRVPSPEFLITPVVVPVAPGPQIPYAPETASIVLPTKGRSSPEIFDYQGLLKAKSIENELLEAGYTPQSRILIKDEKDGLEAKYIKSIDRLGNIVYVELDAKGYVPTQPADLVLTKAEKAEMVPYSVKSSMLNCAQHEVSGVAIECINGLCVIQTITPDMNPAEASYVHADQEIIVDQRPTSYPVVKLTEIRVNPALILRLTANTVSRIRLAAYTNAQQKLKEVNASLLGMVETSTRLNGLISKAFNELTSTTSQIDTLLTGYMNNPLAAQQNSKLVHQLEITQAKRNDLYNNLVDICLTMGAKTGLFNKEKVELESYISYLENNYSRLGEMSLE